MNAPSISKEPFPLRMVVHRSAHHRTGVPYVDLSCGHWVDNPPEGETIPCEECWRRSQPCMVPCEGCGVPSDIRSGLIGRGVCPSGHPGCDLCMREGKCPKCEVRKSRSARLRGSK